MLFQSIVVYALLIMLMISFSILAYRNNSTKSYYAVLLIFSLLFGMRYGVGIDFFSYQNMYENWNNLAPLQKYSLEPAFIILTEICTKINLPLFVYFSILCFIQIYFLFKPFRKNMYVLAYLSFTFIATGIAIMGYMNVIRQSIAFSIFFWSIQYISNRKLMKYIAAITLAVCFHKSAIILYPVYFITYFQKTFICNNRLFHTILVFISIGLLFVGVIQDSFLSNNNILLWIGYEHYTYDNSILQTSKSLGIMDFLFLIVNLLVIYLSRQMLDFYNKKNINIQIIYITFLFGVCSDYLFNGSLIIQRFFLYFSNMRVIIYALLLYYLFSTSIKHKIYYFFTLIVLLLHFARIIYYSSDNTSQYAFFFQYEYHNMKEKQVDKAIYQR